MHVNRKGLCVGVCVCICIHVHVRTCRENKLSVLALCPKSAAWLQHMMKRSLLLPAAAHQRKLVEETIVSHEHLHLRPVHVRLKFHFPAQRIFFFLISIILTSSTRGSIRHQTSFWFAPISKGRVWDHPRHRSCLILHGESFS